MNIPYETSLRVNRYSKDEAAQVAYDLLQRMKREGPLSRDLLSPIEQDVLEVLVAAGLAEPVPH